MEATTSQAEQELSEDWVDARIVADHVRDLIDAAWTQQQIARVSTVNRTTIQILLGESKIYPPQQQLRASTAHRLLSTGSDRFVGLPDHAIVESTGTHRRIRAMAAVGFPVADTLYQLSAGSTMMHRPTVTVGTARKTVQLFNERSYTPGLSQLAMKIARDKRWPPRAAWNDNIDDPRGKPRGVHKS